MGVSAPWRIFARYEETVRDADEEVQRRAAALAVEATQRVYGGGSATEQDGLRLLSAAGFGHSDVREHLEALTDQPGVRSIQRGRRMRPSADLEADIVLTSRGTIEACIEGDSIFINSS